MSGAALIPHFILWGKNHGLSPADSGRPTDGFQRNLLASLNLWEITTWDDEVAESPSCISIRRSEGVITRSEGPFAFSGEFISLSGIPKTPSDPLKSPFEGEKGHPDLRKGRSEGAKARSRELKRPSATPFGPSTRPKGGSERPKAALAGLFGGLEGPKGTIDPSNALEVPA